MLVLLWVVLPPVALAGGDYAVGPAPAWVAPLPLPAPGAAPPQEGSDGLQFLLSDAQTRVTERGPQHFQHLARRIATEAGVENGAELRFDVNPAHERLTLHWVRVHRAGTVRDALAGADVHVVQREEGLEARMFDGTRSVLVVLQDVRVGDVVDYAYTTTGQNPVFEGRWADSVSLGYEVPVERLRFRLLWPAGRPLQVREHGAVPPPTRRELDGELEWVWERTRAPAVKAEDRLPPDFDPYPWVQLSEWASWQDVADWAARQFQHPTPPAPAVAERAAALAAAHASPASRLLGALRFVQDEVRYLGFELGPNSHRPHPPEWVLARRFGDCKDKSLLLVALLEGLGVEATPALVNTREQAGLDRWLPTPLAFDHVIVRAKVDGREVWVDPTRTLERGGLEGRLPPAFGRALLVSPATQGLVPIPEPAPTEPQVDVEEHYEAREEGGPVTLEVVTRYRGEEADRMRRHAATTPLADVARDALNFYARRDTRIRPQGDATVVDDPEHNVLTLTERYVIEGFWDEDGERQFWAWPIEEQLASPQIAQRSQPLEVTHPVDVRYAVRLSLPREPGVKAERRQVTGAAFRFDAHVRSEGRQVRLDYRFRSRVRQLGPEQVASHLADQRRVRELLGYEVTFPAAPVATGLSLPVPSEGTLALGGLTFVLGVLAFVGLSLLVANRFALRARLDTQAPSPALALVAPGGVAPGVEAAPLWAPPSRDVPVQAVLVQPPPVRAPEPASAPARALAVEDEAALAAHLARQVCACGAPFSEGSRQERGELLRLGERLITPVALTCATCGRERWLYFTLPPEAGAGQA